jgi:hypothetical protein
MLPGKREASWKTMVEKLEMVAHEMQFISKVRRGIG